MSGIVSAEQRITPSTVRSGESVEVSVSVRLDTETDDLRLIQRFGPSIPAAVSVLRDDGATIAETTDENDALVGSWGGVTTIEFAYSIRVPEEATGGDEIGISGTVEDRRTGDTVTPEGETTIRVVQSEGDRHESGVDQDVFDAVDQTGDGDVSLGELQDAVADWSEDQQIDGVDADLGDLRAIVDWWAS